MPSIPIPVCARSDAAPSPGRAALRRWKGFPAVAFALLAATAHAADQGHADAHYNGATLSLHWALPFAGLLLSMAIVPLFAAKFWHRHYGKVVLAWALALLVPFAVTFGAGDTLHNVVHALLREYVPFVAILFALFTIAGGICLRGALAGPPLVNVGLLALGASTRERHGDDGRVDAADPAAHHRERERQHKVHVVVFFILLVGNVGGALSPLGDPPLFIGFLKGVDFFWTTRALARPRCSSSSFCSRSSSCSTASSTGARRATSAPGGRRSAARAGGHREFRAGRRRDRRRPAVGTVASGRDLRHRGCELELPNVARDVTLVLLGLASLAITPAAVRAHNQFHWEPIFEVAKLFAAIFVTIFPVLAILEAGRGGALAGVLELIGDDAGNPRNTMVYWVSGLLSAFLDNAPTYLVFFNLAGGDPERLMGPLAPTLAAISMGAVYFGSLTYIGNAPNFMIKAIAEDRGIAMPSFFAYLGYASLVMLPLLAVVAALWL